MSKESLKIISEAMDALGLNYALVEYPVGEKPSYPYFVGEYQEIEPMNEDGMQESTFMLTGFSRGTWLELEETKDKISSHFNKVGGRTVIADNGSAVAVFYSNSLVVPTGDAELKKIQINLDVKEWSVK
jgi:hypothetical protein